MRRGLTLAGAQRRFQFPAQAFGFLFQALDSLCAACSFSCCARSRSRFGTNSMLSGCLSAAGRPTGLIQPYGSRSRIFCPAKSSDGRFQRSLRLVNKYGFSISQPATRLVEDYLAISWIVTTGPRDSLGLASFQLFAGPCSLSVQWGIAATFHHRRSVAHVCAAVPLSRSLRGTAGCSDDLSYARVFCSAPGAALSDNVRSGGVPRADRAIFYSITFTWQRGDGGYSLSGRRQFAA